MNTKTTEVRRRWVPLLPLLALLFGIGPANAETTRTLRQEMAPGGAFGVENLAGTMRVTQGSGSSVVVVATVHAVDDKAAGMMRIDKVSGEKGMPTLRLIYPIDEYGTIRYRGKHGDSFMGRMFGGSSTTRTEYAGEKVRVSTGEGTLLYADVEVQIPKGAEGHFRNVVGEIEGTSLEGKLSFDSGSGDITLKAISGDVDADTGSGDIEAESIQGSFTGDTGSGNIEISSFEGEKIDCDTGSGNVRVESFTATRVKADTGSGNIRTINGRMDEFDGSTGSGNIEVQAEGGRLRTLEAGTGSGNVVLRLGNDASFEAMTDTGSGNVVSHYDDAEPIINKKEVIGYRRGGSKAQIKVSTGSGNVVIEPGT